MPKSKNRTRKDFYDRNCIRDDEIAAYRDLFKNADNVCPILGIPLDDPVLDHDHKTGKVRGVISRQANTLLGRIENYLDHRVNSPLSDWGVVENVLAFLSRSDLDSDLKPFHPEGLRQVCKRFAKMKKAEQIESLERLCEMENVSLSEIDKCSNSRKRKFVAD